MNGQRFLAAWPTGTSMLPLFQPHTEIYLKPIEPVSLRKGDVVAFRNSGNQLVVAHRIVGILRDQGSLLFLTKGDNRIDFDPPVAPDQIVGKVTQVGPRRIDRGLRLWLGRWAAFVSYLQGIGYRWFSGHPLNRLRHSWERKGWIPRMRLSCGYRVATNPLGWLGLLRKCSRSYRQRGPVA